MPAAYLVFNDLSGSSAVDRLQGTDMMQQFVDVVLACEQPRCVLAFCVPPLFDRILLAPDYPVGRWRNERTLGDEVRRRKFKIMLDKRVYYEELAQACEADSDAEYSYEGNRAEGLSLAFRARGVSVSFRSAVCWNATVISIERAAIDSAREDVVITYHTVPHASAVEHVAEHHHIIELSRIPAPRNGEELWSQRAELYPSLEFCESAEVQVRRLTPGERFNEALRGLADLQAYCATWKTPHFDPHAIANASGESRPTMDKYGDSRKFKCPDGGERAFEYHIKRHGTRVHFIADVSRRRILIGYVGRHLPIVSED
jgi:hypothetical protein